MVFIENLKASTGIRRYVGFTLAEVLITLGIIGVVAAITIPTLISKYQKQEYVTRLKKAYSEFNQALRLMANDYGCPGDLKCTKLFDGSDTLMLGEALVKYFKVSKNCGLTEPATCWPNTISPYYDGSNRNHTAEDYYADHYNFITADGMTYSIRNDSCADYNLSNEVNITQLCAHVWIDINGPKGPNNWGRDNFEFFITNGKGPMLYPWGGKEFADWGGWWQDESGVPQSCDVSVPYDTQGEACAGKLLENGWNMDY